MLKKIIGCTLGLFLLMAGSAFAAEIVVVVNGDAPVNGLTAAQVRAIYLGESRRWNGTRIIPVAYDNSKPIQREFLEAVVHMDGSSYDAYWIRRAFRDGLQRPGVSSSTQDALKRVRSNRGGIGFFYADEVAGAGVKVVYRVR